MTTVNVDVPKVNRMAMDALRLYNNSGAHPAEVVLALSQATGRVIASLESQGSIVQRELLDAAISNMARAIEANMSKVITQ